MGYAYRCTGGRSAAGRRRAAKQPFPRPTLRIRFNFFTRVLYPRSAEDAPSDDSLCKQRANRGANASRRLRVVGRNATGRSQRRGVTQLKSAGRV